MLTGAKAGPELLSFFIRAMQIVRISTRVVHDWIGLIAQECAKRWQHSLDPSLDHSEWKTQDDDRLLAAVTIYGRNWKTIKDREFPGRSTTDIKNR